MQAARQAARATVHLDPNVYREAALLNAFERSTERTLALNAYERSTGSLPVPRLPRASAAGGGERVPLTPLRPEALPGPLAPFRSGPPSLQLRLLGPRTMSSDFRLRPG